MAKSWSTQDSGVSKVVRNVQEEVGQTGSFNPSTGFIIDEVGVLYENASPGPYIAVYIKVQATTGRTYIVSDGGFRILARMTGNTRDTTIRSSDHNRPNPWSGLDTTGNATGDWYRLDPSSTADITLTKVGSTEPTTATSPTATQRFPITGVPTHVQVDIDDYDG